MFGIGVAELMVLVLTLALYCGMAVALLAAIYGIVRKAVRDELDSPPENHSDSALK